MNRLYPSFRISFAGSFARRVSRIVRTVSGDALQGLITSIFIIQYRP